MSGRRCLDTVPNRNSALYRLQRYASELQQESDMREYVEMIARVEKRIRA